jgi:ATP-dependent protease ClpP protease subunit
MNEFKAELDHGFEIQDKGEAPELFIYDVIGQNAFTGEGISDKIFATALRSLGPVKQINLRINSPGGSVFDANAMYNLLIQHPAKINVFIDGIAASAASYLAMAGDTIAIAENANFMIHEPWAGIGVVGTAEEIRRESEKAISMLESSGKSIVLTYAKRTGKSEDEIRAMMSAETWFTGPEAMKAGFATSVIPAKTVNSSFAMMAQFKNAPNKEEALKQSAKSLELMRMRMAIARAS